MTRFPRAQPDSTESTDEIMQDSRTVSPASPSSSSPPFVQTANNALRDHQRQLMALEQRNKKRLLEAMNPNPVHDNQHIALLLEQENRKKQLADRATQDHQMHKMLREQRQKKRLCAERNEALTPETQHEEPPAAATDGTPAPQNQQEVPSTASTGNRALQDYTAQLMFLDQEKKRKLLPARNETPMLTCRVGVLSPEIAKWKDDPQMQLILLEQQNKKALLMARRKRDMQGKSSFEQENEKGKFAEESINRPMQDYEMQRLILEQQNKKRMLMARHENPTPENQHVGTESHLHPDYQEQLALLEQQCHKRPLMAKNGTAVPEIKHAGIESNHQADHQMQLMLLEQQNQKKTFMARQETDVLVDRSINQQSMLSGLAQPSQETDLLSRPPLRSNAFSDSPNACQPDDQYNTWSAYEAAKQYTKPFCDFLTNNPTVYHAVDYFKQEMKNAGWTELNERDPWKLKRYGHYFVERNGSSLIAFVVGADYQPGNGAAIVAGHVDALTAKLKPFPDLPTKAGFKQLGIAPYADALNKTWWDRDLGIGGRVLVKDGDKVVTKLVKLDWPIARIPTLAPHFGAPAQGPFNLETQMVPIIGLDDEHEQSINDWPNQGRQDPFHHPKRPRFESSDTSANQFISSQPRGLVKVIGEALGLQPNELHNIVNWELELFDIQPATVGGLKKDLIFAGRIDDKLCSYAAMRALLDGALFNTASSSVIKMVGLFDNEEVGSLTRQGARGDFLPRTLERAVGALASHNIGSDVMGRTYANSFLVSADVTHAVNPNFLNVYLENHSPQLNVGLAVSADSNANMTSDAVSVALFKKCAQKTVPRLQVFQARNDSREGGTIGPALSSMMGMRAIDVGIPQLSMHSIRATTGSLDPGLGVIGFMGFLNGFESVDKEFRS